MKTWLTVQWFWEVVPRSFAKVTESTLVLGGRLSKTLTVQWFLEVILRSIENMADSTMLLGSRSKKFTARTMVSRGCKARFSNDLPKPLSWL